MEGGGGGGGKEETRGEGADRHGSQSQVAWALPDLFLRYHSEGGKKKGKGKRLRKKKKRMKSPLNSHSEYLVVFLVDRRAGKKKREESWGGKGGDKAHGNDFYLGLSP